MKGLFVELTLSPRVFRAIILRGPDPGNTLQSYPEAFTNLQRIYFSPLVSISTISPYVLNPVPALRPLYLRNRNTLHAHVLLQFDESLNGKDTISRALRPE